MADGGCSGEISFGRLAHPGEDGDELIALVEQQLDLICGSDKGFLKKFDPIKRLSRFFLDNRDFMYEISATFCATRFAIVCPN